MRVYEFPCEHCGIDIQVKWPSEIRRYCSRKCSWDAKRKTPGEAGRRRGVPYLSATVPLGHPLIPPGGCRTIKAHRVVLWDKIGPGPHPCHHCGAAVDWAPGARVGGGILEVDHLDYNPRNNDPCNVVPCCRTCNIDRRRRKRHVADEDLFESYNGTRFRATKATCSECGEPILVSTLRPKRQFCGYKCAGKHARRVTIARRGTVHTARSIKDTELYVVTADGKKLRAVEKQCEGCGAPFVVATSLAARRRFCSHTCGSKWGRWGKPPFAQKYAGSATSV